MISRCNEYTVDNFLISDDHSIDGEYETAREAYERESPLINSTKLDDNAIVIDNFNGFIDQNDSLRDEGPAHNNPTIVNPRTDGCANGESFQAPPYEVRRPTMDCIVDKEFNSCDDRRRMRDASIHDGQQYEGNAPCIITPSPNEKHLGYIDTISHYVNRSGVEDDKHNGYCFHL